MEENNLSGQAFREPAQAVQETAPQDRGFPVYGIPALVMLALMVTVFALEISFSLRDVSAMNIQNSSPVGMKNYEYVTSITSFTEALQNSLILRSTQLFVSTTLAAGFCALFYAMRKPKTVLTFACLWLVPACVPYLSMTIASLSTVRSDSGGLLLYLCTTVLQTTSVFCFFGGLFTFLTLKKKGRAGGGPYYGLAVAVLAWALSALTTSSVYPGTGRGITLDTMVFKLFVQNMKLGQSAALSVVKIVLQALLALVPMIILCIMARRKSVKGKTPLAVLWIFLAIPTGILALLLFPNGLPGGDLVGSAFFNTLVLVTIGGSFGGLVAYSFIHLLRRVPAFLFALIALVLAASLNCLISLYFLFTDLGLRNTVWPQALLAAFDGRMVWIVIALAFALRDWKEARPGSLAVAVALLAGAFLWGEFYMNTLFNYGAKGRTLAALARELTMSVAKQPGNSAFALLAIPPLVFGAGAALLLKHSLNTPEKTPETLARE